MYCGESKAGHSNYYTNVNPLFKSERLQICKNCITDFIGNKEDSDHLDNVKLVLALMNRPFLEATWIESKMDWSKYIPKISSLQQHSKLRYKDSDFGSEFKQTTQAFPDESLGVSEEDLRQLRHMWGKGFELEDYLYLESEYETFLNSYECDSYAQEMLFQEISHKKLEIRKLHEENKPTDKELKTLQELLGSSNIKPVQETGANATEQATFGTLIKKFENDKPIPEPDEEWKDVDGIKQYVNIWFFGHLSKMLGKKNKYSEMYEEELAKHTVDTPEYDAEIEENQL